VRPLLSSRCSFTRPIPGTLCRSEEGRGAALLPAASSAPFAPRLSPPPPPLLAASTLRPRRHGCWGLAPGGQACKSLPLGPGALCWHSAPGSRANIVCTALAVLVTSAQTLPTNISGSESRQGGRRAGHTGTLGA